jgi:hypothetical protein
MKNFILALTLLCSTYADAETEIALCEKEGSRFGDGLGRDAIPLECAVHFLKRSSAKLRVKSLDGSFSAFAYKNIIFIKDTKSKLKGQNIIAGKYTELEEIQALTLDEKNKEIIVLEKSGQILAFSSVITGNVAPYRKIKSDELEGASEIAVNPVKKEIIVLKPQTREILFYSRETNTNGPEEKKNHLPIGKIENVSGKEMKIDLQKQELEITEEKRISIYGLVTKELLSLKIME